MGLVLRGDWLIAQRERRRPPPQILLIKETTMETPANFAPIGREGNGGARGIEQADTAAAPTIALGQTTATSSNQTGNNTPGQVFNNDTSPNGGTTGTYNGASPTRNNGNSTGTYNGPDRTAMKRRCVRAMI
jgi:hypothetical protein